MNESLTLRRKTAIEQLEKQLELGTKPNKAIRGNIPDGMTATAYKKKFPRLSLTPKDTKRINNTIAILKTKLQQP